MQEVAELERQRDAETARQAKLEGQRRADVGGTITIDANPGYTTPYTGLIEQYSDIIDTYGLPEGQGTPYAFPDFERASLQPDAQDRIDWYEAAKVRIW